MLLAELLAMTTLPAWKNARHDGGFPIFMIIFAWYKYRNEYDRT